MGREFIPLFEDWAATYDATVHGLTNNMPLFLKDMTTFLTALSHFQVQTF